MIEGGFYLKARRIQEAAIMHAPPHVREIWDWLLMKAMFADGISLQRGQVLTSYNEIQRALSWNIGWRIMRYSRDDCEKAMKWLRKADMVTTTKTTRGVIITICKYDYYQNPKNYESHTEDHRKTTGEPHKLHTIDKNDKKERSKEKKKIVHTIPPSLLEVKTYCQERGNSIDPEKFVDYYEANGWMVGKNKMRNWQAAIRTWEQRDNNGSGSKQPIAIYKPTKAEESEWRW
jgi:hypothetical protein